MQVSLSRYVLDNFQSRLRSYFFVVCSCLKVAADILYNISVGGWEKQDRIGTQIIVIKLVG